MDVKVSTIAQKYGVDQFRFESFLRNRWFGVKDKFTGAYIEESRGNSYAKAYIMIHKKADEIGISFASMDSFIMQMEGPSYKKFYENIDEEKLEIYAEKCVENYERIKGGTNDDEA